MSFGRHSRMHLGCTKSTYFIDNCQTMIRQLSSSRYNPNPKVNTIVASNWNNGFISVNSNRNISKIRKNSIKLSSITTDTKEKGRKQKFDATKCSSLSSEKILISSTGSHWSMEKVEKITKKLKECTLGNLTESMTREACQAISSLAHLTDKKDSTSVMKYDIGFCSSTILDRLTAEEKYLATSYDDDKSKKIQFINSQMYNLAIKCMIKSTDSSLIMKADETLMMLEQTFLKQPKSSTIQPFLRSYTILFDFLNHSHSDSNRLNITDKVESLLQRIEEQEKAGNIHMILNTTCFNAALNALVNSSDSKSYYSTKNVSQTAITLLNQIIESQRFQIDSVTFSTIMKLLAKNVASTKSNEKNNANAISLAIENILVKFNELGHRPNAITMTSFLNAFAKNGDTKRANNLLEWMQELYEEHDYKDIRPNRVHFNTLIDAFANSDEKNSGKHALEILRNMEQSYLAGENEDIKPDLTTYNSVLNAISKEIIVQGEAATVNNAEELLQEMEEGCNGRIFPDVISYNSVLSAWMYSDLPTATDNIERLLQKMKRRGVEPNTLSYTICINAYANCETYESAQKAEDMLRIMKENFDSGISLAKPDIKCYNCVLRAWANCGRLNRARKIFEEMKELSQNRTHPDLEPNVESHTIMIHTLANSCERNRAQTAQHILDDLIRKSINSTNFETIDVALFNVVIDAQGLRIFSPFSVESVFKRHFVAWAKSGEKDACEKVEAILAKMKELSSSRQEGMENIRPNTITFNSVLNALSKSRKKGSSIKAEAILRHMQDLYEAGDTNAKPDTLSFSSVLNAHARSGEREAGEKAEKILKHMFAISENNNSSVIPNTICFSTVINAHAKSRTKNSAQRAENVLRWMQNVFADGNTNVKPNTISFTSVADAWSKSGRYDAVEKTYDVIRWMEELHKADYKDVKPNTFTYNCLLNAIARSKDDNKAKRALKVLRKMQNEFKNGHTELEPNIFSFNSVILACAFTKGNKNNRFDALKLSIEVFEETMANAKDNDSTNVIYGSFFQACGYLTKNNHERQRIENIVETVFRQCCLDGQVDDKLIRQIHLAASESLLIKIFSEYDIPSGKLTIQDLPQSWSKNVKKRIF